MVYKRAKAAASAVAAGASSVIFHGDCRTIFKELPDQSVSLIISSPPYCMGKEYERHFNIDAFTEMHSAVLPEVERVLKPGGSVCWQVGFHVRQNAVVPLDYLVYDAIRSHAPSLVLRNRIIWHFGHGHHCDKRFSGRYETINWFTKGGADYHFDLDSVRVPQKYPGKKASRGPRAGLYSGNPAGKNPSDVWDIPNVKANHVEKTDHPCQYPVALAQRLVGALSRPGDLVMDPFSGVSSTGVACALLGRRYLGAEIMLDYVTIAEQRLKGAVRGDLAYRDDVAVMEPDRRSAVATAPPHFIVARSSR